MRYGWKNEWNAITKKRDTLIFVLFQTFFKGTGGLKEILQ